MSILEGGGNQRGTKTWVHWHGVRSIGIWHMCHTIYLCTHPCKDTIFHQKPCIEPISSYIYRLYLEKERVSM